MSYYKFSEAYLILIQSFYCYLFRIIQKNYFPKKEKAARINLRLKHYITIKLIIYNYSLFGIQ